MVSAASVVYGTDAHCYDQTDCSSQSGSGKSQTDWEYKLKNEWLGQFFEEVKPKEFYRLQRNLS